MTQITPKHCEFYHWFLPKIGERLDLLPLVKIIATKYHVSLLKIQFNKKKESQFVFFRTHFGLMILVDFYY